MGLGAIALGVKQKFGHGAGTWWYRDHVRPKVLKTAPTGPLADTTCEIHALTCKADWLNLIWALKSFYLASGRQYRLCVHEDGSLDDTALSALRHHFPGARLVTRAAADRWASGLAAEFPRVAAFRRTHPLALKIVDFMPFLAAERMLVFDSDLLFFREPTVLLQRIEDARYQINSFNEDIASAYAIDPSVVRQQLGFDLVQRFNSGLGLVQPDSIRLDWLEEFLALPGLLDGHFWRIEQTLFALCSSRYGVESLPAEYCVSLDKGIADRPVRHYVGHIRHLMYTEGMRRLVRDTAILADRGRLSLGESIKAKK